LRAIALAHGLTIMVFAAFSKAGGGESAGYAL